MPTKYSGCTVQILHTSKAACLCLFDKPYVKEPAEFWIPYSQIENPENVDASQESCDLSIATWILDKNNIEYSSH